MIAFLQTRGALLATLAVGLLLSVGCGTEPVVGTPEALVEMGWAEYRLGEFGLAVERFASALDTSGQDGEARTQALYGLGTTWNLRRPGEDPAIAHTFYEQLVAGAPDHDLAAWSLLALARMEHLVPVGTDPDYEKVRAAYQEVVDGHPGHPAADEAFVYRESTRLVNMEPAAAREALVALDAFVSSRKDSGFLSAAYSLKAVCHEVLDQPEAWLAADLAAFEAEEVDPSNPFHDDAWRYWNLAALAEFEAGDFDTARTFYQRLIDEYPTDVRRYGAQRALDRIARIETRLRSELEAEGGS